MSISLVDISFILNSMEGRKVYVKVSTFNEFKVDYYGKLYKVIQLW
jgi:hypothetical protein